MAESASVPWDAGEYDAVASIQERWGARLIERIPWVPDAVVLDAGCGSGRLLPQLLGRIPQGALVAADVDAGMLREAQQRYRALRSAVPVTFVAADLGQRELPPELVPGHFDLVFSNAVLHWIRDKIRLFGNLNRLLKPGGALHAEFGGDKNLQRTRAAAYRAARNLGLSDALAQAFSGYAFQAASDTKEQLKLTGFRNVSVVEHVQVEEFPDEAAYLRFCTPVVFRLLKASLTPEQWDGFSREFAAQAYALHGGWKLDYVRQTIQAEK